LRFADANAGGNAVDQPTAKDRIGAFVMGGGRDRLIDESFYALGAASCRNRVAAMN
jgi:hypothetical protein